MEDIGYQIEPVSATRVASEDIDRTFRSSCIGKTNPKSVENKPALSKGLSWSLRTYSRLTWDVLRPHLGRAWWQSPRFLGRMVC